MGYDCTCRLMMDGRTFNGTALLEQKELVFRGDLRLSIPLAAVEEVHARGGSLFVTFGGRRAVFDLDVDAEKWVKRITSPPARVEKLGVRAGMRVAVVGLDDVALVEEVEAQGATIVARTRSRGLDAIFFAATRAEDLDRLPALAARLAPSGALWLLRVKGRAAAISERESMAAGKRAGLVDVKVVSYSDTLSAEKYVIPVAKRPPAAGKSRRRMTAPVK